MIHRFYTWRRRRKSQRKAQVLLGRRSAASAGGRAFRRARFGKYEKRESRLRLFRWAAAAVALVVGLWFVWESALALGLFQ